VPLLTADKK